MSVESKIRLEVVTPKQMGPTGTFKNCDTWADWEAPGSSDTAAMCNGGVYEGRRYMSCPSWDSCRRATRRAELEEEEERRAAARRREEDKALSRRIAQIRQQDQESAGSGAPSAKDLIQYRSQKRKRGSRDRNGVHVIPGGEASRAFIAERLKEKERQRQRAEGRRGVNILREPIDDPGPQFLEPAPKPKPKPKPEPKPRKEVTKPRTPYRDFIRRISARLAQGETTLKQRKPQPSMAELIEAKRKARAEIEQIEEKIAEAKDEKAEAPPRQEEHEHEPERFVSRDMTHDEYATPDEVDGARPVIPPKEYPETMRRPYVAPQPSSGEPTPTFLPETKEETFPRMIYNILQGMLGAIGWQIYSYLRSVDLFG